MDLLARIVSGRRAKFLVLALWLGALVALGSQIATFESRQQNEPTSFLPGDAESVAVLEASREFRQAEGTYAIAVFARASGLSAEDRASVEAARAAVNAAPPEGVRPVGEPVFSEDGRAALLVVPIVAGGEEEVLIAAVESIRDTAREVATPGLTVKVTGPAGYSADASKVFEGVNSTLLLATSLLVLFLLVLIYRSPIFWALPLAAVFFAEGVVRGLSSLLAEAGVVINGQTAGLVLVLVFGAGTDYALLLTARYREELTSNEDAHEAMRIAVRKGGPAIVASAATVVAALLCLTFASVNSTSGLGPVGAWAWAWRRSPCSQCCPRSS